MNKIDPYRSVKAWYHFSLSGGISGKSYQIQLLTDSETIAVCYSTMALSS